MEEGRGIGLTNLPSGHETDGECNECEDHQRKRQPPWMRTAEIFPTEFLAHAYPPLTMRRPPSDVVAAVEVTQPGRKHRAGVSPRAAGSL